MCIHCTCTLIGPKMNYTKFNCTLAIFLSLWYNNLYNIYMSNKCNYTHTLHTHYTHPLHTPITYTQYYAPFAAISRVSDNSSGEGDFPLLASTSATLPDSTLTNTSPVSCCSTIPSSLCPSSAVRTHTGKGGGSMPSHLKSRDIT